MTEEIKRKGHGQPPPLISRHRNTIILHSHMLPDHAPCSVSKVNLVTLSPEPLLYIFKAAKSILSVHKGFFFSSQTTIICFKGKSSFQHLFCYSEDALGYETGKDRHTKEGPLRECDETHSWGAVINKVLLYFLLHFFSGKSTLTETTNPKGLTAM